MCYSASALNVHWLLAKEGKAPDITIALYTADILKRHKKRNIVISSSEIAEGVRNEGIITSPEHLNKVIQAIFYKSGINPLMFPSKDDNITYSIPLNNLNRRRILDLYFELRRARFI